MAYHIKDRNSQFIERNASYLLLTKLKKNLKEMQIILKIKSI